MKQMSETQRRPTERDKDRPGEQWRTGDPVGEELRRQSGKHLRSPVSYGLNVCSQHQTSSTMK